MSLELLPKFTETADRAQMEIVWNLISKQDWAAFLESAPLALSQIGNCYVAASHEKAALIELPQNEGGRLRYKHDRANLIHCSDLGREAFREAEIQMLKVQLSARHICEPRGTVS